ncbi:AraC family transcriptional regulator (plasmid) [Clostridiaceae bacterium 14S0207]|nr:AraC family transcriptional regulator [Clostridiaceae bacterium 14S0207]
MYFEDIIKKYTSLECVNINKFSPAGKTFYDDNEFYNGYCWIYIGKNFIIDIHSFFIKKEYVVTNIPNMTEYIFLISNYIISGSGEWLNPYQSIEPTSMLIMETSNLNQRYVLHGNSIYRSVGLKFKESLIEEYVVNRMNIKKDDVLKFFLETQNSATKLIGKLAKEILECKLDGIAAELFFEAKAKEWLGITLDSYEKKIKEKTIPENDTKSMENVAKYISDHYAFDIPQEFLEKICMMSGTKLKQTFKQKYNMTITEFIQRKRINIAENLLLTTNLKIRDVAKAVGYKSPNRFTTLFKRYKGLYPKDVRKYVKDNL